MTLSRILRRLSALPFLRGGFQELPDAYPFRSLSLPRLIQGRELHPPLHRRIGASGNQSLCNFIRAVASDLTERRVADRALIVRIYIGFSSKQEVYNRQMALLGGVMKRRHTEIVKGVGRTAFPKEFLNERNVASLRSAVQGMGIFPLAIIVHVLLTIGQGGGD